jgi:aspartyl-tRNA(Asn)/glutamyl-tRNA(Gln) amidotransferase subunit C
VALTREQVLHIASLVRIALTEPEVERLREQLSDILEQFEALRELDTASIQPTTSVLPLASVMREDEPRPAYPKDEILANAPAREGDFFRVRVVLEES